MDALRNDLRLAFRQIRRRPGFALVAAASLALGVGANTAVFNAVSALLLRPVPGVSEPERVVEVGRTDDGQGFDSFSYPDYEDLRDQVDAFASMAAWRFQIFSFSRAGEGERIMGMDVSPSYFEALGVKPALGRFFTAEEDLPGSRPAVTVLSHDFWTSRLGADPDVLGSTVLINRVAFTVVGVAPEPFHGHVVGVQPDVYRPIRMYAAAWDERPFERRGSSWHQAVARLADGASIPEADAQVKAVYARLEEAYPDTNEGRGGAVVALGLVPGGARGPVSAFLSVLFALAGLILMVTCANVAGMLVARASAREKEIAVRLALGSGRGRLVRQLLTESLVVFGIGGVAGAASGVWLVGLLPIDRLPVPIPVRVDLSPDFGVLAFALALTLGTGVVFGLLPALQATRLQLVASLRDDGSRRSGAGRLRRVFVGGQVAFRSYC
jgi:predicted permease